MCPALRFYLAFTIVNKASVVSRQKENQKNNPNIDNVISDYKPLIFWKDKEIVKSQIKVCDLGDIKKLMYKLGEIELLIKKHNLNSMNILYDFIISQAKTNNCWRFCLF